VSAVSMFRYRVMWDLNLNVNSQDPVVGELGRLPEVVHMNGTWQDVPNARFLEGLQTVCVGKSSRLLVDRRAALLSIHPITHCMRDAAAEVS
jgi:hypothetical protein